MAVCPKCGSSNTVKHGYAGSGNQRYLCKDCGSRPTIPDAEAEKLPSEHLPVEELIEHRIKQYQRKAAYEDARRAINVKVNIDGPIGIHHFGDPHVDDDGTDLALLKQHIDLINKTEGLFGANVGDTTNNWVGRLARLYGEQGTTAAEAWMLAEWFIKSVNKWIYIIGGNHDCWSGSGDPLKWICRQQNALYESSEARIKLSFRNGRHVMINARHDFAGHSQWNPTHGAMKAAQMAMGQADDLYICGHKHTSGYSPLKRADGGIAHCIQVASYKIFDRYARERGFRDQHISPGVLTVIDPNAKTATGLIEVFHDIERGADYLTWLRKRAAA